MNTDFKAIKEALTVRYHDLQEVIDNECDDISIIELRAFEQGQIQMLSHMFNLFPEENLTPLFLSQCIELLEETSKYLSPEMDKETSDK